VEQIARDVDDDLNATTASMEPVRAAADDDVDRTQAFAPVPASPASAADAFTPQASADTSASLPASATPIDETLKDPLLRAPRTSSVVLCVVFGLLFVAAAGLVWWVAVRTTTGQEYDDLVWETLKDGFPAALGPLAEFFTRSTYVIGLIIIIGIVSVLMVVVRRRWLLLIQLIGFALASFLAGFLLKGVLPRPTLDPTLANPSNTSPSGHSVAAFAAAAVLVMAVPMSLRAIASVVGFLFASSVGISVVVGKWHRPSDVIVAFLLVTGLALITMAFTRASGMDKAGARRSSASVQIVSTVMLVAGVCGLLFTGYLVWQLLSGLGSQEAWTVSAAQGSAMLAIMSTACLGLGVISALRQITASPLSAVGLVGAPPAPPAASQFSTNES
jgi:membrane-associated phospholipid phosphatase